MILPIPATRLGPQNAVDTRPFRTFLEDVRQATRRPIPPSYGPPPFAAPPAARAVVFDVGSYAVVLAESPRAVLSVLGQVLEPKRPAINDRMLQAFEACYPGWPVAVCCWSGNLKPEPLLGGTSPGTRSGCSRPRYTRTTATRPISGRRSSSITTSPLARP